MKFSVVIATYNRAELLRRAVACVQDQTYKDWELIIVDDGSTDHTPDVVKSLLTDTRIREIRLTQNSGSSEARNAGIRSAVGEWVMVWDSDDELDRNALEILARAIEEHPEAGIISAPAIPVRNGIETKLPTVSEGWITLPEILCKHLGNYEKVRVAKRELFEVAEYRARNIDFMVNAYLARQAPWYHLSSTLGRIHVDNPDSLTRSRKRRNPRVSAARYPHLNAFLLEFGSLLRCACPSRYAALSYGASRSAHAAKNHLASFKWSYEAWVAEPYTIRYLGAVLVAAFFVLHARAFRKLRIGNLVNKE